MECYRKTQTKDMKENAKISHNFTDYLYHNINRRDPIAFAGKFFYFKSELLRKKEVWL